MSIADYFTFPRTRHRMYAGPLGPHIDTFMERLQQQGYAKTSIRSKVRAVANFSLWLGRHGLGAADVDAHQQKRFLTHRKRLGRRVTDAAAALRQLADLLQEQGLMPATTASKALGEQARAVQDFKTYLLHDRGLSAATLKGYLPFIARFLSACFGDGPVRFETLTSAVVIGFVERHAYGHSPSRAQLLVKALRAYLRYLHHHGTISRDLAACVPAVAAWSFSRLPRFLSPDELERVLRHCERQSAAGRRDYAMLLLLARLGLRAGEVAALTLDEIDWTAGCLVIRSKGGRWTPLPLPQEVGAAIADYLRQGRPPGSDRHVFIRHRAPRIGFASSNAVSAVAARALARAGIHLPRQGAHLFRHTLATELLRQGASLTEIGQLLRHQHPDTTRLYAQVELAPLRELAQPWPGGEQ